MEEKELNVGSESVEETNTDIAQTTGANAESVETAQKETTQQEQVGETTQAKSFTQEQVNEFVRERIDRERNSVYKRYGVENRAGLDELVGKSQAYDVIKERYDKLKELNTQLTQDNAFITNNIADDRRSDILAYFKGKNIDFNNDALVQELQTHPEWLKVVEKDDKPITTIEKLGADRGYEQTGNERDEMAKLFGLSKLI